MMTALLVFCATFALDFVWTKYIARVGDKRAHAAAFWSMAMIPLTAVNVVGYTTHWWLVFPAMAGAYLSTWWAVWRDRPKEPDMGHTGGGYCTDDDCTRCNTPSPQGHADHVDMFKAAGLHWSKDPEVPYDGCGCRICKAARDPDYYQGPSLT